jgi:outer membrane protein assembly factor BamE (lipoprotein component of BamABCDE complex)
VKKILLIVLLLSIYGCATYTTTTEGNLIHENMIADIETGETTEEWIIDLLGEPTKRESIGGDKEKLLYIYTEKSVPKYFFNTVVDESKTIVSKSVLEIVIKEGTVFSYKYKSRVK